MLGYFAKVLAVLTFWLFVIQRYYSEFNRAEGFDWYAIYIIFIFIVYAIYSIFLKSENKEDIKFSPIHILGLFLFHLFFLSGMYFSLQDNGQFGQWMSMFAKVVGYSILPTIIVILSQTFWKTILKKISWFDKKTIIFQHLTSLNLGIFLFITILTIFGFFGLYQKEVVIGILIIFAWCSFKELVWFKKWLFDPIVTFERNKESALKFVVIEFLFLISTLVLSVNLINILRPMPIGWDDLWVYMNYPHLFAEAWEIVSLWGIHAWQVFTGIWYLFHSPTQAFYLNVLGWFLSFISILLITKDLIPSKKYKTYLPIPMLLATMFICMPMVVFEQAKDMKVDPALFFTSIITLYIAFKVLLDKTWVFEIKTKVMQFFWKEDWEWLSSKYIYFLLIGLFLGFSFTLKFTSLLLIIGVLGLLFYAYLGLAGFLWYFSIFVGVFTKLGLWKFMNIVYPSDNIQFVNTVTIICAVLGFSSLAFAFNKYSTVVKSFLIKLFICLTGIIIAISPWFVKHIITSDSITIWTLLSWNPEYYKVDYADIYSDEELVKIQEEKEKYTLSQSGTTTNEDWGRYFWYEEGINNFVKLPWNLTIQVNQKGEFTEITYWYLVLLPLILLFLPFRKTNYSLWICVILAFAIAMWFIDWRTKIFSWMTLPGGYLFILFLFIAPLLYFLYSLKETDTTKLFKYNMIFAILYVFLWTISAYGVVWYGIVMYFSCLLAIWIGLHYLSRYTDASSSDDKNNTMIGSLIVFWIISIYFFLSVFPNTFNNLKNAWYDAFKVWQVTSTQAPFVYHSGNLKILFALNIAEDKKEEFLTESIDPSILKAVPNIQKLPIKDIEKVLKDIQKSKKYEILHNHAKKSLDKIYAWILNPEEKFKNTVWIYRIWTFLRYYISENNKRLYEDSLVMNFDTYIHNGSVDSAIENMKKIGLEYLLVDLNAATIDNDPRRNLTKRYEKLLRTFASQRLELISTDSMCLQIALEDYRKSNKTVESYSQYMIMWWANYNSYLDDGKKLTSSNKTKSCINYTYQLFENKVINENNYPYLLPYYNYYQANIDKYPTADEKWKFFQSFVKSWFKVLFKIK